MRNIIIRFSIISILFCFASCQGNHNLDETVINHLKLKRAYLSDKFGGYEKLYNDALDSINLYVSDTLKSYQSLFDSNWAIDSIFIFNQDSTRFYSKLLTQGKEDQVLDYVSDFGGAYIERSWYFFEMGTLTVIPREQYKLGSSLPLEMNELSFVAWNQGLPGLIKLKQDSSIQINYEALDRMWFSPDRYYCPNVSDIRKCKDSIILDLHAKLRKFKLNKKKYLELIEGRKEHTEMLRIERRTSIRKNKIRKKDLLFETIAWKERYKENSINDK
jgi:hypothetical protein